MAFHIFNNYDEGVTFVICVVCTPISVVVITLRFLQSCGPKGHVGAEEWFVLLALVTFLIYVGGTLYNLIIMNGQNVFTGNKLPMQDILGIYKSGYVINIQTPLNQTFAKLSLLALYNRLFHVNRRFTHFNWSVAALQIVWCIVFVFIRLFRCTPLVGSWNLSVKSKCIDSQVILAVGDSINSFLDFVIIGMAIWIVQKLQMPVDKKLKLSVLFVIGGISGLIGIVRFTEAYGQIGENSIVGTWIVVQQMTSILCCCAPIYKTLLQGPFVGSKIWTRLLSGGRGHSDRFGVGDQESEEGREVRALKH